MFSLKQLYLTPEHPLYLFCDGLSRYFCAIIFITFLCFNAYPTYLFLSSFQQQKQLESQIEQQQLQLHQQNKLYSALQTRKQQQISHDQRLNETYRKIQHILQQKQAEIESIHWNNEQQSISLVANHYPAFLFQIIRQFSNEPELHFSEILLTKHQHGQIQLSASLFIQSEAQ